MKKGFTIIEMVVVMAIIAIITTVVLVEYRGGAKTNQLQLATQQAINDLKETQNLALSSQKSDGDVPEGGYGIRFSVSSHSYTIFADEDADKGYDTGEEIRTVSLFEGIEISDTQGKEPLDIVFLPPNSDVFFGGEDSSFWTIDLRIIGTSETKTITIYDRGAIEVRN